MTRHVYPAVEAVGALIRTRTELVDGDNGQQWRIHAPCLLQMLVIHLHASSGGTGAGGHGAGTLPINTQAWDLLVEIRHDAYAWAQLLAVDPAPYARVDTPRAGKPVTPPIGKLLRAVAVVAETTAREQVADAITRCARRWTAHIEEILAGHPEQRGVRGASCPECTTIQPYPPDLVGPRSGPQPTRTVLEERDDGSGRLVHVRVPAIVLVVVRDDDGGRETPTLCCLACGWNAPLAAAASVTYPTPVHTSDTPGDDHVDGRPGQAA